MGMDDFASNKINTGRFIVQNIAANRKTVRIFQYPILYGTTRDIMQIPGISESSIRASLLKGEIRNKILAQEIIVLENNVDLLQFNANQLNFLHNNGIIWGTQVLDPNYQLLKTLFSELTLDVSTTSTSFTDLLTINISTGNSNLLISANISGQNTVSVGIHNNYYRIAVDGVALPGGFGSSSVVTGEVQVASTVLKCEVLGGNHTVTLQWKVTGGTGSINPVTNSDFNSARLLVQEVAV